MGIQKPLLAQHAIMALALVAALTFPCVVRAVGIGEIMLKSRLGEPLLAQVDLKVGNDERIEASCLSLATPDPLYEDISSFLTEVSLALKTEGKRQYVVISSPKPFNDAFARVRLQVKCPGTGGVIKTLTVSPSAQTDGKQRNLSASSSRPNFSSEPIDKPHAEKLSAEEGAALLARQKLLEASVLSMQHHIRQMEGELTGIKMKLTQLGGNSSAVVAAATAASAPMAAAVPLATDAQESHPTPNIAVKQPLAQQDNPYLQEALLAALGLALFILAVWLGGRHHTKIKSRIEIKPRQDVESVAKVADDLDAAEKMPIPLVIKHPSHVKSDHAPDVAVPFGPIAVKDEAASHAPIKAGKAADEEDSMLEEARLYANYGRSAKAIEILHEITRQRPSKADAWTLLLSIYSSLGKAAEFESTAREFLKYHEYSPSWSGIKALGRTFDKNNRLYIDNNSHISVSPLLPAGHPIGDILVEMGILSKQDLQHCLDDFDPKKHGRLGGYLVARRVITLEQLDQALLQQQGVSVEVDPSAMPSLRDMENFLADFDPKRDGSVGEFIASRKAVTPEQLSHLLRQQSVHKSVAEPTQAAEPPPLDKGAPS